MTYPQTLRSPTPLRVGILLIASLALWLASALSFTPTVANTAAAFNHADVCKCAHCPGEATCCCSTTVATCPVP